jgi:uracil-DNA glycosylase
MRQSADCLAMLDWRPMNPDRTKAAHDLLGFYAEAGVDALLGEEPVNHFAPEPVPPASPAAGATQQVTSAPLPPLARPGPNPRPAAAAPALSPDTAVMAARDAAKSAANLQDLRAIMQGFQGCALRVTATQLVFADGNPQARVMFVGEAPGRDEDLAGLPFVGRSGKLLDRMLAAIGFDRTSAYIANIIP